MKNYEIKQAFKNLPDAGLPDNDTVMCREYEQCEGCNYPAHGFICWHGDKEWTIRLFHKLVIYASSNA